jgi:hypothetical protein
MILDHYISEQLAIAYRRDLLEAAERERLAGQAREDDRHRLRRRTLRPGVGRPRPIDSSLCGFAPGIARS